MVQEKNIVRLGLTIIMLIALLGLVSTPALAHGRGGHHWKPAACSKTASAAFLACQNEVKDDYWIAKGNCYNATEDQAECFAEAKEGYKDAREECGDQLEARKEVCEEVGEAPYDPEIDPDDFVDPAAITAANANPYFPLVEGYQWVYEGGGETITVTVTGETVTILGVTCREVTDIVTVEEDGEDIVIEETKDWYAQDTLGNVWYMGERSLSREDCEEEDDCDTYLLANDGSWIAGVDSALPGIIMFGDLSDKVGTVFRQEFFLGDAEDVGEVKELGGEVYVEATDMTYPSHVVTEDTTPLEPDVSEDKFYAEGLGLYKEVPNEGDPVELVSFTILP